MRVNSRLSTNEKQYSENYSVPAIVLCNLNPFKGSELFKSVNGSGLYDSIVDKLISANPISDEFLTVNKNFSKVFSSRFNHGIQQMLISCKIDNEECAHNSFASHRHGLLQCYQLPITSLNRIISLVLNSEQYDYLVPVSKYVGFKIWINNGLKVNEETVIATPGNHNIVDIKVSEKVIYLKNFSGEKHLVNKEYTYSLSTNIPEHYSIIRLNQVMTLPIYAKLIYKDFQRTFPPKSQTSIYNSHLIQCRSILRYFDKEAFLTLEKSTEIAITIDRKKRLLLFNYAILNSFLIENLNSFDKLTENTEKCTFMIKIQQIKDSLTFFSDSNYYFSFMDPNETIFNNRESKQLSILRLIYTKQYESQANVNVYQKHINLLSDIIVKVSMHFKYQCDNNIVENVSASFLSHLETIRTLLLDYKNAISSFGLQINNLRMNLNKGNQMVYQEKTGTSSILKNSLVSVTFNINNNEKMIFKETMNSIFILHYFSNMIELLIIFILIMLLLTLSFNLVCKYHRKKFTFKFSNSIVQYQCQTTKRISEINANETSMFSSSNIVSNDHPITFLL